MPDPSDPSIPEPGAASPETSVAAPEPAPPTPASPAATPAAAPAGVVARSRGYVPARPGIRDLVITAVSVAGLAALMAHQGHWAAGVLVGMLLTLGATVGILGLLGDSPLDLRGDEAGTTVEDRTSTPSRPWWRREGSWVVGLGSLLYLPFAGAYGLWDPWETHYSEVAREILSRDDWITTWWGQEGWFMSKPVLIFWMSALGMGMGSLFGLQTHSDSGPQFQEWCIRVPICLLAIGALWALYRAVARAWGPRAGFLVALVLGTMPHWFFLAHQAMTDMPFVAPLTLSIAMLMAAVTVGQDDVTRPRRFTLLGRSFRVSLWHLAIGAVLLVALPQIVYLLTRPMLVACPPDARMQQCAEMLRANRIGSFQFPVETYFYGSRDNSADTLASSVPGSPQWERLASVVPFFPSAVQGVIWLLLGGLALWLLRGERRARDLYYILFYFWCGISTMGKGPAGLAIPAGVAALFLVTTAEWRMIRRTRIFTGLLVFCVVGLPWYVAILGRLGNEFFDRFVVHDIINRTLVGVHGDTGTFRYFVWQLGYAMFPWCGLVPVALLGWRQIVPPGTDAPRRHVARIGLLLFLVSFFLFSAMVTKFHHYIFPAVPGAAVMVGLLLDRMMGAHDLRRVRQPALSLGALVVGLGALTVGIASFYGSWRGIIPRPIGSDLPAGNRALAWLLTLGGAGLTAYSWWLSRDDGPVAVGVTPAVVPVAVVQVDPSGAAVLSAGDSTDGAAVAVARVADFVVGPEPSVRTDGTVTAGVLPDPMGLRAASYGAMGIASAVLLAFVARDLGYAGASRPPGYQRLLQLFTYQYERQWPTASLDYHPVMVGFGGVAVAAAIALAVHRLRPHAVRALCVVALLFAGWALDVYMIDVSHHWSQRGLFELYFRMRHVRTPGEDHFGEDARYTSDPIGAYQMNWKGENFYTGNHAAMLDCGDLPFCSNHLRQWLDQHRGQRLFFVTERAHGPSLESTLRQAGGTAHEVTDEWDNNKFVLIEAQAPGGSR